MAPNIGREVPLSVYFRPLSTARNFWRDSVKPRAIRIGQFIGPTFVMLAGVLFLSFVAFEETDRRASTGAAIEVKVVDLFIERGSVRTLYQTASGEMIESVNVLAQPVPRKVGDSVLLKRSIVPGRYRRQEEPSWPSPLDGLFYLIVFGATMAAGRIVWITARREPVPPRLKSGVLLVFWGVALCVAASPPQSDFAGMFQQYSGRVDAIRVNADHQVILSMGKEEFAWTGGVPRNVVVGSWVDKLPLGVPTWALIFSVSFLLELLQFLIGGPLRAAEHRASLSPGS